MSNWYQQSISSSEFWIFRYYPNRFGGKEFRETWRKKYKRSKSILDKLDFEARYDTFTWSMDYCIRNGWTDTDRATGEKYDRIIFECFPDGEMTLAWWED